MRTVFTCRQIDKTLIESTIIILLPLEVVGQMIDIAQLTALKLKSENSVSECKNDPYVLLIYQRADI